MKQHVVFSQSDKGFRRFLAALCVVFGVVIPVLNNFALSFWASAVYGDIMKEELYSVLKYTISVLSTVNLFCMYAVVLNCILRFELKNSWFTVYFSIAKILITYISYFAIPSILTTNNFFTDLAANIIYLVVNAAVDFILLFGVIVITVVLRKVYLKENKVNTKINKFIDFKNPVLTITFWIAAFISFIILSERITSTAADIYLYGCDNLNLSEIWTLVSPYLSWIIKCVCGYGLMVLSALHIERLWNLTHRES